jgi:uncharacterized OsmC-like protein
MSDHPTRAVVEEAGLGPYVQNVKASNHAFLADEPLEMKGQDRGPAPYDLLLASLGACTSMTLRLYADQKGWPLEKVSVALTHRKEPGEGGVKKDIITRAISLEGPLDDAQRQRLLEIANKCPVHRTLENSPQIESTLA